MQIIKPTLIVNKDIVRQNIRKMLSNSDKNRCEFHPHYKTHQSEEIAEIFEEFGIKKITVSSVSMADDFIYRAYKEITIAFPFNILEYADMKAIADEAKLNILVNSLSVVKKLKELTSFEAGVFIKIDVGNKRSGIDENHPDLPAIVKEIEENENLTFEGFMGHTGNNYSASSKDEILENHKTAKDILFKLKEKYPKAKLSLGDTPSCTLSDDFKGIDYIRPGNFVYYDYMQYNLGVCEIENIAAVLACPVVGINQERQEVLIYGGAVHLSKDKVHTEKFGDVYGVPVAFSKDFKQFFVLPDSYVSSLSQEHGIVKLSPEYFKYVEIGFIIGIIPVHSCLTTNLMKENTVYV